MSNDPGDLVLFLGRFHPLLVHLPIGGLVLLGALELVARFSRFKAAAQNRRWILALTSAGVVAAAACGWLLSQSGDYDPQLVRYHRWTGIAVAMACLVTTGLSRFHEQWSYRVSLAGTLVLLVVASHFGGSLTHGRDFLTRYAPAPLRLFAARKRPAEAPPALAASLGQPGMFAELVQPILQRRCVVCHGPEKHKGGLRLDSLDGVLRGGENGPVVIPGNAADSGLVQRLLLPIDHDDHMPPSNKDQPTAAEIETVRRWIDSAAPADRRPADPTPTVDNRRTATSSAGAGS